MKRSLNKKIYETFFNSPVKRCFTFLVLASLLAGLAYYKALSFALWKDDWILLWNGLYHPEFFRRNWMHPGTNIEFLLLSNLLQTNFMAWQIIGISFRIAAAIVVAAMTSKITRSHQAGLLAGLFFAVSPLGIEAISWPAAHVVTILTLVLCLTFYSFFERIEGPSSIHRYIFPILLVLSLAIDPWRAIPAIFLFTVMSFLVSGKKKIFLGWLGIIIFACLPLLLILFFWHKEVIVDTQFFHFFQASVNNPSVIPGKLKYMGNYINSLGNLMVSWILPVNESVGEASYKRGFVRFFVLIALLVILVIKKNVRQKRQKNFIFFCLAWMFIMYIPNWLFEPRITVGGTHRYLVVSSVGLVAFLGYAIAQIQNSTAKLVISLAVLIISLKTDWLYLDQASVYRDARVTTNAWTSIIQTVPRISGPTIFIFLGEDPVKTQILMIPGFAPYAVLNKIRDPIDFAISTDHTLTILNYVCNAGYPRRVIGLGNVATTRIPMRNIYAWSIDNNGVLVEVSRRELARLVREAKKINCDPVQ